MRTHRDDDGGPGEPRPSALPSALPSAPPSDAEIRAIAEQLVRELREPPPVRPGASVAAQRHELAPADEERVSEALVELGAAAPKATMRADRLAAGDLAPRPRSWGVEGRTPERADER